MAKKPNQEPRIEKKVKADPAKKLEGKINELTADLQRVHADFVNYKRRTQEDQSQIMTAAKQAVISRFLPLVDNLERALGQLPKELEANTWAQGVSQIAKQMETVLKELGVERISAVGKEFDPHMHEAMSVEDGSGKKEVVSEEIQTGWKMGDQIIRPSLVKVRK